MRISLQIENAREVESYGPSARTFGPEGCILGRSSDCDWRIGDKNSAISRRHARVSMQGAGFVIEDFSTNGVFVNESSKPLGVGNKISLLTGDRFRIGEYKFRVSLDLQASAQGVANASPPSSRSSVGGAGEALWDERTSTSQALSSPGATLLPQGAGLISDEMLFGPMERVTYGDAGLARVPPRGGIDEADLNAIISELRAPQTAFASPNMLAPPPDGSGVLKPQIDLDSVLAEFGALSAPSAPQDAQIAGAHIQRDAANSPFHPVGGSPIEGAEPRPEVTKQSSSTAQFLPPATMPLRRDEPVGADLNAVSFARTDAGASVGLPVQVAAQELLWQQQSNAILRPENSGTKLSGNMFQSPDANYQDEPTQPPHPDKGLLVLPQASPAQQEKDKSVPAALVKSPEKNILSQGKDDDLPFWRGLGIDPSRLSVRARQESLRAFASAVKEFSEADNVRGIIKIMFERLAPSAIEHKLRISRKVRFRSHEAQLWDIYVAEHREICLAEERSFTDAAMNYAFNGIRDRNFAHAVGVRSALSAMLSHLSPATIESYQRTLPGSIFSSQKARMWRRYVVLYQDKAKNSDEYLRDALLTGFYSAYRGQLQRSSGELE